MSRLRRREAAARMVKDLDFQIGCVQGDMARLPKSRRHELSPKLIMLMDRASRLRHIVYGCECGEARYNGSMWEHNFGV